MNSLYLFLIFAFMAVEAARASFMGKCMCDSCIYAKQNCGCQECIQEIDSYYASQQQSPKPTIKLCKCIGVGSFGSAWLAESFNSPFPDLVAVKKQSMSLSWLEDKHQGLKRELRILKLLKGHPNFPEYYSSQLWKNFTLIVMEYISRGTLGQAVRRSGPFRLELCRVYCQQLFTAVQTLHSYGIIHRDISINNIMFNQNGTLKLIDFGLSRFFNECNVKPLGYRLPLYSWAPECRDLDYATPQQDVWSAGYCLAFMAIGDLPFMTMDPNSHFLNVKVLELLSDELKRIILGCLRRRPCERLTTNYILNDPWLSAPNGMGTDLSFLDYSHFSSKQNELDRIEERIREADELLQLDSQHIDGY